MNWKLTVVVLISLILLVVCYLTISVPNYFTFKKEIQKEPVHDKVTRKFKIDFLKEEDFKNFFRAPEGATLRGQTHIAYYFPGPCPYYKLEYFLVDLTDEGLETYHVPEEGYLIIVKKDHKWTKEPDFTYWKLE